MSQSNDEYFDKVMQAMQRDRFRLRRFAQRIEQARSRGESYDQLSSQFEQLWRDSRAIRELRRLNRPAIDLNRDLPIWERRQEIADAIREHPVVVICGETGSGKSTQIPQICLEMGRGIDGWIGHTQPRRIAARSVASRLADELHASLGNEVGFKVRFTDSTGPRTYIKLMTDGIMLAETQGDRFLDQYDTIIVDEAHERSLNIDFLLGFLKRLVPRRPDLRVIITSATIDAERFRAHFGSSESPAPVIHVSGRTYPVDVWYRPPEPAEDDDEPDRYRAIVDAVDELFAFDRQGDILVFLATEREILDVAKILRGRLLHRQPACEILPLYARLSIQEQQRVFESHPGRRIVLATNVAESSLTVPGIRYVIDEGTARISRYSPRSKIQRLPIEPISRASADQRKGRCGRLGPGICVRLYGEDDYLARDPFTPPEIRRSNLAAVILQAEALKLGRIDEFPFLDPPQSQLVRDGYTTLFELGAVDERGDLTPLGARLSRLPVDPRIGRMILAGADQHCLHEVLVIASALEVQDPRERPVDKQQAADEAHRQFADPDSDFLTYLNLWNFYHDLKTKLSRNRLQKACHQNFLSHMRLREWLDVHRQLQRMLGETRDAVVDRGSTPGGRSLVQPPVGDGAGYVNVFDRMTRQERDSWYGKIHRSLLTGLLCSVATRGDKVDYLGANNVKLTAWPGSAVAAAKPKWIVAAEFLETSRLFARTIARISPDWIEPLAQHLVQRSYSDPHWNAKSGSVMAYEKVTLFGLTLAAGKLVPYGPIDAEYCRDLFIRHALVGDEIRTDAPFLRHNREMRREVETMMAKTRRTDLAVDDYAIYGFYAKRLPPDVFDAARLNQWRKQTEPANPKCLFMELADLTRSSDLPKAEQFPDHCQIDRLKVPLEYHFEPNGERDGVTIVVPGEGLKRITSERLGWLVPGLVEQQVLAVLRALPKNLRRALGPAPDLARQIASQLKFGDGSFLETVARLLSRLAGERITADMVPADRLPPFMRLNVRVVDEKGQTIAEGRDVEALREELGVGQLEVLSSGPASPWFRDGITRWDFGDLPESVEVVRGGLTLTAHPAIVDQGSTVGLRLVDSPELAARLSRAGVRRLVVLHEHRSLKSHLDWFPDLNAISLLASGAYRPQDLRDDLAVLIADRAFVAEQPLPASEPTFSILLRQGQENVELAVQEVVRIIGPMFRAYHAVRLALDSNRGLPQGSADDLNRQLSNLIVPRFLIEIPWPALKHFPRYLEGMKLRIQKLTSGGAARDQQLIGQLEPFQRRFQQHSAELQKRPGTGNTQEWEAFRWMLEEFRISLFAQSLGTAYPVSAKRLEKQWEECVR